MIRSSAQGPTAPIAAAHCAALSALVVTLLLASTAAHGASEDDPFPGWLAGFSFEADEVLDTGPDNLGVFERGRGQVALGHEFRTSGTTAVVLRDVSRDGDFPELMVYFEEQRTGKIWLHFGFLLTTTGHEMNIGLAGPSGFGLGRDGLSFWLALRPGRGGGDGWLVHMSDSIPRRLFSPRPFTWFIVDVVLDLDAATYDLVVQEEGMDEAAAPLIELYDQPTVARHPGAAIDKFSFIGDRGTDSSAVEYWIDDVIVATEKPIDLPDFLAPGRRRTFVERLSALVQGPTRRCPQVLGHEDFAPVPSNGEYEQAHLHRAWEDWKSGCAALERGDAEQALRLLQTSARLVPESMTYTSGHVLALMATDRVAEAEAVLSGWASRFQNDPRYPLLVAEVAEANDDVDLAEEWLRFSAQIKPEQTMPQQTDPVEPELAMAGYYGLLLRNGEFEQAWDVADSLARRFADRDQIEEQGLDSSAATLWWERAGDAAYLSGATSSAEELYQYALTSSSSAPTTHRLWLKLSDVLWSAGDLEGERELRERVYGRLD